MAPMRQAPFVVLGAITPLGGLCFMAGWLMLARAAWPVREDAATR